MNEKLPKKLQYWLKRENIIIIKSWARNGLTDSDIAKNMGISRSTLSIYKKKSAEFNAAISESKEVADMVIENALYEKAKRGDVTAMIYWLKNRRGEKWRDKPSEKGERDGGGVIVMPEVKADE